MPASEGAGIGVILVRDHDIRGMSFVHGTFARCGAQAEHLLKAIFLRQLAFQVSNFDACFA